MGREATCHCQWGDQEGDCKVLLEASELILRAGISRRVPVSSLTRLSTVGENLVFHAGQDRVQLRLGREAAERWLKAITTPPPSLSSKLGISPTTRIRIFGAMQTEELKLAIANASMVAKGEADVVLVCANLPSELDLGLHQYLASKISGTPVWIVYPKGPSSNLKESSVRQMLRGNGFTDTKVVSVSPTHTALRFVKQKPAMPE